MQRRAGRLRRAAFYEVGHGLGLGQVQLVVQERALREFTGLCPPRTELDGRVDEQRHHDGAAVTVQLQYRLAGKRCGRREIQRKALVDGFAARVRERSESRLSRFR
jgi:hypothetical protein